MHEFKYRDNELYCEDVKVRDAALKFGTPLYLYSYGTLIDHYRKLKEAFSEVSPLICFSVKANSNLAVLRALVKEGAGLDIVSGGELYKALKVRASPKKIVYASVGKGTEEIREAIRQGILMFNVESLQELVLIDRLSREARKKSDVAIRLNPDIDPDTHEYIKTAKGTSKFGLDVGAAQELFLRARDLRGIKIKGIHIHIGSQITEAKPFVKAIGRVLLFIEVLKGIGLSIEWLNLGGGMGIVYKDETPQTAKEFADNILPLLRQVKVKFILEPGRFIAGPSGILVTKVLYLKGTGHKNFVIVDAGMNDLIRPSLYDAYHEIVPLTRVLNRKEFLGDVVGPICESGDFLAKDRKFIGIEQGDLLGIMGTGAYGFVMSSNYNSRPRAAEAMVMGKKMYLVRRRETYQDLVRGEVVPGPLR